MKTLATLFAIYITFGASYEIETEYQEQRMELIDDSCAKIVWLTCGIELTRTDDKDWGQDNTATIYIERTFELK